MNDSTEEFRIELSEVLKKYGMSIDADYMGDIILTRGKTVLGYWRGVIRNDQWVSFENAF